MELHLQDLSPYAECSCSTENRIGRNRRNAMIPTQLSEWNLEIIRSMIAQGVFESDRFDFKEMLPHSKNEEDKERLKRVSASFANAGGGFLIFGVSDKPDIEAESRLVGIERRPELPALFGAYANKCVPPIEWDFLNPPISLPNGRVIHVIHIPRSWRAPHGVTNGETWAFCSRSNSGTTHLPYSEIQMLFLNRYEKVLRLRLLQAELIALAEEADRMSVGPAELKARVSDGHLSLELIESVITDTYSITYELPELLRQIQTVRRHARAANMLAQGSRAIHERNLIPSVTLDLSTPRGLWGTSDLEHRNRNMNDRIRDAKEAAGKAMTLLSQILD